MNEQLHFQVGSIYGAEDGAVTERHGVVQPLFNTMHPTLEDLQRPLVADGVHVGDFAIFAAGITPQAVGLTTPYLVTEQRADQGLLVPWHIMRADMRTHATQRLAEVLRQVPYIELVGMQIGRLTLYLDEKFPPTR